MKLLLSTIFVLAAAIAAAAQCDLTLKDAPAIRGLKFGMSGNDVIATIGKPDKTFDPNPNNWSYYPATQLTEVKNLDGIMLLEIQFIEGKLSDLSVKYNQQISWKDAREFAQSISESLKLPMTGWTYDEMDERRAEMACKDFALEVDTRGFGNLHLVDLIAKRKKAAADADRESQWKKTFKP